MLMEITKNYNEKSDGKAATKILQGDLPHGPVAETPHSKCRGLGSIPDQGGRSHMLPLRVHTSQIKNPTCRS